MRWIFVWTLAALWLPATSHCALEQVGWLSSVIGGCPRADDQTVDHDEGKACAQDLCHTVESGAIKHRCDNLQAPRPALLILFEQLRAPEPRVEAEVRPQRQIDDAAEALPNTWLFVARAALAPRAPSLR